MSRLTFAVTIVATATILTTATTPVFAQNQGQIAERLNDEGKQAMYANNYSEAAEKFRQAFARSNEPRYQFNLCTAQFQLGDLDGAFGSCNGVLQSDAASDEQKQKAEKLIQRIKDEARNQGKELNTGGGPVDCAAHPELEACKQVPTTNCQQTPDAPECQSSNGNNGNNGTGPQQPPRFRPPPPISVTQTGPDNKYTWTLGLDLFGGGGSIGQEMFYATSAAGFRIKGDYMLNQASRVGAQAYLGITHFRPGDMDAVDAFTLDVFDLGIGAYKHLCPRGAPNLCLTPLAGIQLALMSPAGESDSTGSQVFNYAALGGRLEVGLEYAFGRRQEHVLGVQLGVNLYSAVFSGPGPESESLPTEVVGLDQGGAFGYLGIGYTYRFNTPLGSSPFVTLE
jgi:hypothetical protein